jgi:hypothetical protein
MSNVKKYFINDFLPEYTSYWTWHSNAGAQPRFLSLVFDKKNADYIFWLNEDIILVDSDNKKNIGWLTESKEVDPVSNSLLINEYKNFIDNYTYIFTHNKKMLDLHEKIKWVPAECTWVRYPKIYEKNKLISAVIGDNIWGDESRKRFNFSESIKTSLDLFGNGRNPIKYREDGLKDYMFSICWENSIYPGYFTEKILDCFATGTIPIYRGDPEIGSVFNMDGIILLEDFNLYDLNKELYYSKINAIQDNLNIVRDNFLCKEDYIYLNYLQ